MYAAETESAELAATPANSLNALPAESHASFAAGIKNSELAASIRTWR